MEALADVPVRRALIARAAEARDVLPDALRERGAEVDVVALYETVAEPITERQRAAIAGADYVTFTSSSTVRFFFARCRRGPDRPDPAGQHRAGHQRHAARARPRARRRGRPATTSTASSTRSSPTPVATRSRRGSLTRVADAGRWSLDSAHFRAAPNADHVQMNDELRLRIRMIGAGIWLSVVLLVAVGAWIAATWDRPHRGGLIAMDAGAALATVIIALLPRERSSPVASGRSSSSAGACRSSCSSRSPPASTTASAARSC